MAETPDRRATVCPACGRPYRALARPKWRLLPAASEPLLALCPDCRRRHTAGRLASGSSELHRGSQSNEDGEGHA
ncbi:MAG TPA: hypothetical protein VGA61_13530 [Anaerolineae bacterium]